MFLKRCHGSHTDCHQQKTAAVPFSFKLRIGKSHGNRSSGILAEITGLLNELYDDPLIIFMILRSMNLGLNSSAYLNLTLKSSLHKGTAFIDTSPRYPPLLAVET